MAPLQVFGSFSGYKMNIKKTQVLLYNYNPPHDVIKRYNLEWQANSTKYLGVSLPKDLDKLWAANYDIMNTKIKTDIARWNLVPFLGLESRIASVKLNILPILLYLFQTLPIEIPEKQFFEWDKIISRYLWKGKQPRIRYKTLELGKNKGGVAPPCLKDYYTAAQLRPIVCWCNGNYSASWKEIESSLCRDVPIQAMIAKKLRS